MKFFRQPYIVAQANLIFPGSGFLLLGRLVVAVASFAAALLAMTGMTRVVLYPLPRPMSAVIIWALPIAILIGLPLSAWRAASRVEREGNVGRRYPWWSVVVYCIAVSLLGRMFWHDAVQPRIQAFRIPSGSMEPTLQIGDFVYLARTGADPQIPADGAIVVYEMPDEPGLLVIKRVLGRPGDTLAMTHGVLSRNGQMVHEPYIARGAATPAPPDSAMVAMMRAWRRGRIPVTTTDTTAPTIHDWGPVVVPPDSVFVLGDNRDSSYDSRYFGFVSRTRLRAQPTVIYWSYNAESGRQFAFLTTVRWGRVGVALVE